MYAAHEPSIKAVQQNPELARYSLNWGRPGDMGILAQTLTQPVGAAWLRLWSDSEKGYGYVDAETPELAIAVAPNYRGQGVGTQLLEKVLAQARPHYTTVSLSVREDNPVLRLYLRLGFVKVPNSDVSNRTGSTSFTMVYATNLEF
ncbi:MAG: GNAT family N-acetyltransferase, partial [Cyanobacteria bacterium J06659_2]